MVQSFIVYNSKSMKIPTFVSDSPIKKIPINLVKLDKENPRIQFLIDNYKAKGLKDDEITEKNLILGLKVKQGKTYDGLKEAIETKGLLEPIWVYKDVDNKYVIIEGNTRKLVFEELSGKYPHEDRWKFIEARILERGILQPDQIDFIRLESHLGGKKPWDPYERSRYLFLLHDKKGYPFERLARESRTTVSEITRDIRAFEIMQKHFLTRVSNSENSLNKFSYFVELGNKKVNNLLLSKKFTIEQYCDWVAEEKIPRAIDVRHLPEIFSDKEVETVFIERNYDEAMDVLSTLKPNITSPLFKDIEKVIDQFKKLNMVQIGEIKAIKSKKEKIKELQEWVNQIIGTKNGK
jgi:hypothetical protein